jgi:hypothetical protein
MNCGFINSENSPYLTVEDYYELGRLPREKYEELKKKHRAAELWKHTTRL